MVILGIDDALQLEAPYIPCRKLTKKWLKYTVGVIFFSQSQILGLTPFK